MTRKSKFNPKVFTKDRVSVAVGGAHSIAKLYVWSEEMKEYLPPSRGGSFRARKYITCPKTGKLNRREKHFETLQDARAWQISPEVNSPTAVETDREKLGPFFYEVVDNFKKRHYAQIAVGTRMQYDKLLRLHLQKLLPVRVNAITPKLIDTWLDELKLAATSSPNQRGRTSFKKELQLLSTILRFYNDYFDDTEFRFPVKGRHRKSCYLGTVKAPKAKHLSEFEFFKFRRALEEGERGKALSALATVQYYQALRVSEVTGLYWEDVLIDSSDSINSKLHIVRSAFWPRKKGARSEVKLGFKNSKALGGSKRLPMFKPTYEALSKLPRGSENELVFSFDGELIEYRQIQHAYDLAFKRAGLPYRGTHVLRHGGCRRVYDTVTDPELAKQILGNESVQATLVYAQKDSAALTRYARQEWERSEGGCVWVQSKEGEKKEPKIG